MVQSILKGPMGPGFQVDTPMKWARISVLVLFFVFPMFALPIFFGAWVVAASQEERVETLSITSTGGNSTQQVVLAEDALWWEDTLLFLCPLH